MAGGVYAALSGMRARLEDLDRLASDLANIGTSGYKTERAATSAAERPSFRATLDSAVDAAAGTTRVDFRPGTIGSTGRDLDVAIEGRGFFVVNTPSGERYTRNGAFTRREDGVLTYPPGFQPGTKYPLVLYIHGGPRSASKEAFSARAQSAGCRDWNQTFW